MTLTDSIQTTRGPAEPPFSLEPQPQFLYLDACRRRILADLLAHVCDGGGPLFLVADAGLGKTMLLDRLASEAIAHDVRVRLARCSAAADMLAPGPAIEEWLARSDGPAALLLDDADALPLHLWRRLLTALQTPGMDARPGPLVLAVTPELYDWLSGPAAGFAGRSLGPVFRLPPLAAADVGRYLRFRLRVAGGRPDLFSDAAVQRMAEATGGVPLTLNRVAAEALALAGGDGAGIVSAGLVDQALAVVDPAVLAGFTPAADCGTGQADIRQADIQQNRAGRAAPHRAPDDAGFGQPIGEPSYADVALSGERGWPPLPGRPVLAATPHARRRRRLGLPRWALATAAAGVVAVVGIGLLGYRAGPGDRADLAAAPPAAAPGEPAAVLPSAETAGLSAFTLARPTDSSGPVATPAPAPGEVRSPAGEVESSSQAMTPPPPPASEPAAMPRDELAKAPPHPAAAEAAKLTAVKPAGPPAARGGARSETPRANDAAARRGAVTPIRTAPAPTATTAAPTTDTVAAEEDPAEETEGIAADGVADQEPQRPRPVREIIAMGDEFREAGDVEWARRLYRAAKERGSGKAATALAETYDPLYTAASSRANAEEARHLYETAVKLGDRSAGRRLQDLDAWQEDQPPGR